ncbi:MAG: hypothetical protein E6Q27_03520 [Aeromicrobium sp.]|nr:MAG: hypothetical protein E6Q27_03520 [Aeromicrobium sp.]
MGRFALAGVAPAIDQTGIVVLDLDEDKRLATIDYTVIEQSDPVAVKEWLGQRELDDVYIENCDPHGQIKDDDPLLKILVAIQEELPTARLLDIVGAESIVKDSTLKKMGTWTFEHNPHVQDLRSAARTALLGVMNDRTHTRYITVFNSFLAAAVMGTDWDVIVND